MLGGYTPAARGGLSEVSFFHRAQQAQLPLPFVYCGGVRCAHRVGRLLFGARLWRRSHTSPPNPRTGQVKPDFPLLIHNCILHTKPKFLSASLFKKEGKGMKWMKEKVEQDPQPRIMSCEIDLQAQSKEQTKRKHQRGRRDKRNSKQRCLFF